MKRLPIGYSTLEDMLQNNCLYIDKTRFITQMVQGSKCYFLSRPRRFGKSLLLDTIKQAFLGNKPIFKGLYLENNWDWNTIYPVIHFNFADASEYQSESRLISIINDTLKEHSQKYKIEIDYTRDYASCLNQLILGLYQKYNQQVVLLVDEYDKSMLDVIEYQEQLRTNRGILNGLYSCIKKNDGYLKFVFLTGVSKFSKAGIFSGLNNLDDITLDAQYADICGYTQANIENELSEYMQAGNVDLSELKKWYNGYNFLGVEEQRVYNPFDLLLFCKNNYTYDCYWFKTGTPSFLIKLFEKNNYFVPEILEGATIDATDLDAFDLHDIPILALLFQSGYLTIKEQTTIGTNLAYTLTYPNHEVKSSLNKILAQIGSEVNQSKSLILIMRARL